MKVGIVLLLGYTLYLEVWQKEGLPELWQSFHAGIESSWWPLAVLVVLLMPVNLSLETLKWKQFTDSFYRMSFGEALWAVLAGATLAMITPQRLGDYAGRVLRVPAEHNWRVVIATAVSSYCQFVVMLVAGIIGILYFSGTYLPEIRTFIAKMLPWLIAALTLFLLGMFQLKWVQKWLQRSRWTKKLGEAIQQIQQYSFRTLAKGLGLALLRYATYSFQYFLLLHFFGVHVPADAAFAGIAAIFLIMSGVPLPPVLGLLARGEVALLVWGVFGANEFSILATTFSLFIINLMIPALLGLAVVVKINVFKSLGYEKSRE